jgi:hypothetical protein
MTNKSGIGITAKAWSEISMRFPENCSKRTAINEIMDSLDVSDKYVYLAKFAFGQKLIEKASLPISKFQYEYNAQFAHANISKDITYSQDPLV